MRKRITLQSIRKLHFLAADFSRLFHSWRWHSCIVKSLWKPLWCYWLISTLFEICFELALIHRVRIKASLVVLRNMMSLHLVNKHDLSHGDNGTKHIHILSMFTEVTYYALNINILFNWETSIMNTEFINDSLTVAYLKAGNYGLFYKFVEFCTILKQLIVCCLVTEF